MEDPIYNCVIIEMKLELFFGITKAFCLLQTLHTDLKLPLDVLKAIYEMNDKSPDDVVKAIVEK
jgi:hypothetical protein